jgi:hypothetical protein
MLKFSLGSAGFDEWSAGGFFKGGEGLDDCFGVRQFIQLVACQQVAQELLVFLARLHLLEGLGGLLLV